MYGEIAMAVRREIPVRVFSKSAYDDLCTLLALNGLNPDYPHLETSRLHFALSWNADELAPYWGEDVCDETNAVTKTAPDLMPVT